MIVDVLNNYKSMALIILGFLCTHIIIYTSCDFELINFMTNKGVDLYSLKIN